MGNFGFKNVSKRNKIDLMEYLCYGLFCRHAHAYEHLAELCFFLFLFIQRFSELVLSYHMILNEHIAESFSFVSECHINAPIPDIS